jgi:hypothetical protein
LRSLWLLERPLTEIQDRRPRIEALDGTGIHETLRAHFKTAPHTWVAWLPQE